MKVHKSQTSVEFIIILGVILIFIILFLFNSDRFLSFISARNDDSSSRGDKNAVYVNDFRLTDTGSYLKIENRLPNKIRINNITIDDSLVVFTSGVNMNISSKSQQHYYTSTNVSDRAIGSADIVISYEDLISKINLSEEMTVIFKTSLS